MAEYIEREELLEDIDAAMKNSGMCYVIGQTLKLYVKRQTAADVAPVRHGRWIIGEDRKLECSECENIAIEHQVQSYKQQCLTAYCPSCGAKMGWYGGV